MKKTSDYTVLVVDDIESIRFSIADFLKSWFRVYEAADGDDALTVLSLHKIDLLITDIRMPVMSGLELISHVKKMYPETQYALMTAYNIDEYIGYAREHQIYNIIPKSSSLDLNFIRIMAQKLLTGCIFGLEHYFSQLTFVPVPEDTHDLTAYFAANHPVPLPDSVIFEYNWMPDKSHTGITDQIGRILIQSGGPGFIRQIIEEIISNAAVRAPMGGKALKPGEKAAEQSGPVKPIPVRFGFARNNLVISVTDFYGTADRNEILYRLERQTAADPKTGLPIGLGDFHGRGLFITREHTDNLVFNIEPGIKTEVILMISLDHEERARALSVFTAGEDCKP